MKKLFLMLLILSASQIAMAQIAIKGGINFASMLFESNDEEVKDLVKEGSAGLTIGISSIIPMNDFLALQPELLFTQKGSTRSYKIVGAEFSDKVTYNYIDIPILLRLSLGGTYGEGLGIYLNAGVYGGFALSGKVESTTPLGTAKNDIEFDDEDRQKRIDFGAVGGVGLSLGDLFLEFRYLHGINNLLDDDANNGNDNGFDKLQHRGVALTAGWVF